VHRVPVKLQPADRELVESLLSPGASDHPVTGKELIETHISWLILTDEFAYKIKKPLVLDFLDFGTLERRKYFCEEEVRLNRPWAPDLYLDVVPITRGDTGLSFGGDGEVVEYAVRMRRFEQRLRLDHQLEDGRLTVDDMRELATNIAARHAGAERVPTAQRGRVLRLTREFMEDNFTALHRKLADPRLALLHEWTGAKLDRLEPEIARRFDEGFVRDCHGDLHLGNLVRLPGGITTFDCIEFSTDLRHIDVMADIAFLVMDLVARQRADLAAHFLNRYLEASGDYAGVALLDLFFVYRCLVRAKVSVIRADERDSCDDAQTDREEASFYVDLAVQRTRHRDPMLIVMHGLSGSGKTWVSTKLMASLPAIRIRSDIERRRLFGLDEQASSRSAIGGGIYTPAAGKAVYTRLNSLARAVLAAGHVVILDAAFLHAGERAATLALAREVGCNAVIIDVITAQQTMRDRLLQRAVKRNDASEAGQAVLDHQLATAEDFSVAERSRVINFTNDGEAYIDGLIAAIERRRCAEAGA